MSPLDQLPDNFDEDKQSEMSFLDHLEELRWHIIRSFIAIGVFAILAFVYTDIVFGKIILGPSRTDFLTYQWLCQLAEYLNTTALCITELPFIIQSRQMTGQFTMHITSSFVVGLICAFPYAFWEIWRFIAPGLYPKERSAARGATFFVSLLFISGVLFGYFLVTPISINFLANYQIDPSIMNEFDIISYVSTVTTLVLASGVLFQLPIVIFFLTKAGLVTPEFLRTYRKHAIVVILILGAVLTPPDPFSQILIAIPLVGLYQISIYISGYVLKKEKRQEERDRKKLDKK
jgi:sec-independent protein translocase protein TatC